VFLEKKISFQTIAQKGLKGSIHVERNIRVSFLERQKNILEFVGISSAKFLLQSPGPA